MSEELIASLIGFLGTLFGVVLTLLIQWIIEKWKIKKQKDIVTLELRIKTYADAIRYIHVLNRLCKEKTKQIIDHKEVEKLKQEEFELYNSFHPIFTMIARSDKIKKYNDLRNLVESDNLSLEDSYNRAVAILDFNLCIKENKKKVGNNEKK